MRFLAAFLVCLVVTLGSCLCRDTASDYKEQYPVVEGASHDRVSARGQGTVTQSAVEEARDVHFDVYASFYTTLADTKLELYIPLPELSGLQLCSQFVYRGAIPVSGETVTFTCTNPLRPGVVELRLEHPCPDPPTDYLPLGHDVRLLGSFLVPDATEIYELELDYFSADESTWMRIWSQADVCE